MTGMGGDPDRDQRSEVRLHLVSFADMTLERAVGVAAVFDAHPGLRPRKVGGDPARITVGDSLAALVDVNGLPVDWLTVRTNKRYPQFEGGEIRLFEGRGGFSGSKDDGAWECVAHPHVVKATFLADSLPEPPDLEEVVALFTELAEAFDACYGYAASGWELWRVRQWARPGPGTAFILRELPNVLWLNCFGPSFVTRWPGLAQVADGRTDLPNGGVVLRTTPDPWPEAPDDEGPFDAPWKQHVLAATGTEPFVGAVTGDGPRDLGMVVPTVEEHFAASPGTDEMPWVKVLVRRDEEKRGRRHASAHDKRVSLADEREPAPALPDDAVEWSTSFDLEDWERFHRDLKRALKGDTTGPLGTALAAEIRHAPVETEDAVDLRTELGVVRMGWFIDDTDVVDLFLHGPAELTELCDRLAGIDRE